jgi:hypothetical protein
MAELVAVALIFFVSGVLVGIAWKIDPPGYSPEPTDAGREFQADDIEHRARRVQ